MGVANVAADTGWRQKLLQYIYVVKYLDSNDIRKKGGFDICNTFLPPLLLLSFNPSRNTHARRPVHISWQLAFRGGNLTYVVRDQRQCLAMSLLLLEQQQMWPELLLPSSSAWEDPCAVFREK